MCTREGQTTLQTTVQTTVQTTLTERVLKVTITFEKGQRCKDRAMEREKRKIRLQQFKKGEKGFKKGSLRINSGSQELSTFVMRP